MPWRGERDPYRIWLSEVILQQTRVEQGMPYYLKFIQAYPDVNSLSGAREEEVLVLWQGLGYYSRCRNLVAAARRIATRYGGKFPERYADILSLPGVGTYTAAAIASFAFGLPHAVVDGNVVRVLARFFGIALPPGSAEGKAAFGGLADRLLDRKAPGLYNQALMDFGAQVCTPRLPSCPDCPMQNQCVAFQSGRTSLLPVRDPGPKVMDRYFHYLVIQVRDKVYIQKRTQRDIWEHLYEFPLIETDQPLTPGKLFRSMEFHNLLRGSDFRVVETSKAPVRKLTHRRIHGTFTRILAKEPPGPLAGHLLVPITDLSLYAFPSLIVSFLQGNHLTLLGAIAGS